MFHSPIKNFRIIAFCEGISYLILLFIAMPIKYLGNEPIFVKVFGMAHGILFILFILTLFLAAKQKSLSLKFVFLAFIASLIPFATFILDTKLKTIQQEDEKE